MERITENGIMPLMDSLGADFLAFAVTPWHAHNLDAAIVKLKKERKIQRGIILISSTDAGNVLISEEEFNSKNLVEIEFRLYEEKKRGAKENIVHKLNVMRVVSSFGFLKKDTFYLLSSRKPYYAILPYISNEKYIAGLVAIIYDEGLAMYMRSEKKWLIETFGDKRNLLYFMHYFQRVLLQSIYEKKLRKCFRCWNWGFLKKVGDQNYEVNAEIRPFLIETLETYAVQKKIQSVNLRGKVLFLTQPYAEVDAINIDIERKVVSSVIDVISKFYPIVHKAHPRETLEDKYEGLQLERLDGLNGVSIETVLSISKDKPVAVVGYTSTALISLKMLWNIPALSLINIVGSVEMSQAAKNDFEDFRSSFGNTVLIPNNLEDLAHELSSL